MPVRIIMQVYNGVARCNVGSYFIMKYALTNIIPH